MPTPRAERAFAALGDFTSAPLDHYAKRIEALLKKIDNKKVTIPEALSPEADVEVACAWVHPGRLKGEDLKVKNKLPGVYVIDGNLTATHSLAFDSQTQTIVLVTGSIKVPYLRVSFGTLLLVEGSVAADYIVFDSFGLVVAGGTTVKKVFIYGNYETPRVGKQPKGVIHTCYDHAVIREVELDVLWRRMCTGKQFLFPVTAT